MDIETGKLSKYALIHRVQQLHWQMMYKNCISCIHSKKWIGGYYVSAKCIRTLNNHQIKEK